jgi:hypothetical protein
MRTVPVLGVAALLAVLPVAAHAQAPAPNQETVIKENTTVVVKEAPKPSPVTFTPYGFFLVNAFFNDTLGSRNYPFPTQCGGGAACEGNILFDVRQSRLGSRLAFNDKAGWTGATLSALVEIDFQGGYAGAVPTTSLGFYSPVVRLRKAYADATWDVGTDMKLTMRLGQDDFIVSPLRPVSLAYVANPLFQNAGTLNGRAPMFALSYGLTPKDGLLVSATVAALNPQDNTACEANSVAVVGPPAVPAASSCLASPGEGIDLGAGNRSRVPNFEGRLGLGWRSGGKSVAVLQGWAGWQKNRFVSPATDTNLDTNSYIVGGDMTLNIWLVQVLGSIYSAKGWDMAGSLGASQGIALTVSRPDATKICSSTNLCTVTDAAAIPALGGWFQVVVGPSDLAQIYGGWGGTQSPANAYVGTQLASGSTRIQNFQWAAGLIGYAGKNWRFSAEYSRATSYFYNATVYSQGQFSINSQVVF